jgi:protocatechuate 3,4-dioxygenase beta subunit
MTDHVRTAATTRRRILKGIGAAASTVPMVSLFGCADDPAGEGSASGSSGSSDGSSDGSSSATTPTSSAGTSDAGSSTGLADSSTGDDDGSSTTLDDGSESESGTACVVEGWASGGTAAMCGNYPDPFADGIGNSCELLCSATLGPCYAQTENRQDISEGALGLPVRLAFLVVDEACTPVQDAEIDIWHTSADGLYSGEDASPNCTFGDPEAIAGHWFRGVQTTGRNGRADFDTCFPGWYSGRTIHIHLTVRVGGVEYVTSQLVFADTLCDEIVAEQPIYSDRGPRDTTNVTDGIMNQADDIGAYTFETEHMSDGAMLAWKALVIRGARGEPLCAI